MYHMDSKETHREKATWELYKDATYCFEQILESRNLQNNRWTVTYLPSHKSSKLDDQDLQITAGEAKMNA